MGLLSVRRGYSSVRFFNRDDIFVKVLRGGVGSFIVKIGNVLLLLSVSVVLARLLGAAKYGVYAYVFAWITILGIPAQLGLPNLLVREVAACQTRSEYGLMNGILRWAFKVSALSGIVIGLLAVVVVYFLTDSYKSGVFFTFVCGVFLIPLIGLGEVRGATLRGLRKIVLGLLPEKILCPALFLVILLLIKSLLPNMKISPPLAMSCYVVASALSFCVGIFLLMRNLPRKAINASPKYDTKVWLSSAISMSLIAGVSVINSQADIVVLGIFSDSTSVGVYRIAAQVSALIGFGLQAMNTAVAPFFSQLYTSGDVRRLQKVVTGSARVILALALPVVLILVVWGNRILSVVFGAEFVSAYAPMAILALGNLVDATAGSVALLLNMTGFERITVRWLALTSVANIFLNLFLVPLYGIYGAAASTAFTTVMWNVLLWLSVRKSIGIDTTAFAFPV